MARTPNPDRGKFEVVAAPDEIRCWLACAEAEDRSLSAWVRRACNEAARRAERPPTSPVPPQASGEGAGQQTPSPTDLLQAKVIRPGSESSFTQSVSDAARELGISETAVRKAIHAGKLVAIERSFGYLIDPRSTADYAATRKPRGGAREPALRLAYGNEPGKSFRVKFAKIKRGKKEHFKDGQITPAEVDSFRRGIFIITGREMHRAFIVVPSSRVHRYEHGRFFIEGRFKFAEKINNPEQASKAFREFEPS